VQRVAVAGGEQALVERINGGMEHARILCREPAGTGAPVRYGSDSPRHS
jgi:hypothetical protein